MLLFFDMYLLMELSQYDEVTLTDQELSDQKFYEDLWWYGGSMLAGGLAIATVIPGALGVVGAGGAIAVGEGAQFGAGALLGGLGKKAFGDGSMWKKGLKGVIKKTKKIDGVRHYVINWKVQDDMIVTKTHRYDTVVLLNPVGTLEAVAAPVKAPPEPTPEPTPEPKKVAQVGRYRDENHKKWALKKGKEVIFFVSSHFPNRIGIQYPGEYSPQWQDIREGRYEWSQLKEQGYVQIPVQSNPEQYPKLK